MTGVPAPAEELDVLSEVHMKEDPSEGDERVSRYRYLVPECKIASMLGDCNSRSRGDGCVHVDEDEEDDDEEEVVRRRRPRKANQAWGNQHCARPTFETLTIVHRMATPLSLVGQQVWSAAFLLADFVLRNDKFFAGTQVLELGAGPGVAGLVAARVARRCYLTDYHDEVFKAPRSHLGDLAKDAGETLPSFVQGPGFVEEKRRGECTSLGRPGALPCTER